MRQRFAALLIATSLGIAACGLQATGTLRERADGGGTVDGASPPDAPVVDTAAPPDGCSPEEDCTDGIDNDCNGLVDCADPACAQAGYVCVPPVPSGWGYAAVAMNASPTCASSFSGSVDVVLDPTAAPAVCTCSCDVTTPPSCTNGTITHNYSIGNGSCQGNTSMFTTNGTCTQTSTTIAGDYSQVEPVPPSGGSCGSATVMQTLPASSDTPARACTSAVGGGCANGNVCAPTLPSTSSCVMQAGKQTCPSGYSAMHSAGSAVSDSRGCTGCMCATTPVATCANAQWSVYSDNSCMNLILTRAADGACHPEADEGMMYSSYLYSATVQNPVCAVTTQPTPTGGVTPTNPSTVCCTP